MLSNAGKRVSPSNSSYNDSCEIDSVSKRSQWDDSGRIFFRDI